jgi:NADPH-dependent glutamate synthase beta subunit-like oxidoreductase
MSRSIAVIGSGPGGMYAAQGLLDKLPGCRIDIFDKLPSPYGLIRGGVAPDHQTTKKIARAFEKTMVADNVRFLGNVEIGRDVSIAELEDIYDALVLAYGAPYDNQLGIPGEDKKNVFGSNAFVGWYNCHPEFIDLDPDLNVAAVAVVGLGNVAIDVARVLAKTEKEMSVTDLAPYAGAAINASPLRDIHIFGRRGPVEAAFTNVELREMGHLENCLPIVDPAHLPDEIDAPYLSERDLRLRAKNIETMRQFKDIDPQGKQKRMHFGFFASPVEILGGDRVEAIRMERTRVEQGSCIPTGETFEVDCGLVVTCIGSRAEPIEGLPFDKKKGIVVHKDGRVRPGVYAVGWVKRGATGTIGTNKNDSLAVVDLMVGELSGDAKPGPEAFDRLAETRGLRVVSYPEWRIINELEEKAAAPGAPRRKFATPADMLAALENTKERAAE